MPMYDELIVLARKDKANDPKIAKFLAALKKGTDYLLAHRTRPGPPRQDLSDLNNSLNKTAWTDTLPFFARDPRPLDCRALHGLRQVHAGQQAHHKELPLADYATELK